MSIKGFEVGGVQERYDYTALDNIPANLVQDANYVHTDNNYTNADKTKLSGIEAQANKTTIDATLTHSGQAADAKATGDELEDLKSAFTANLIHDTATGSIANFPDGAALPVRDLSVDIEPVQDLNGYDNPWPAGGGKNLLNVPQSVSLISPGYLANKIQINLPAGTYTLSFNCSSVGSTKRFQIILRAGGTQIFSQTGDIASTVTLRFTTTQAADNVEIFCNNSNAATYTNAMIESGSTATAYSPYSNICPISGWTGATVTRTGKNLFATIPENTGNIITSIDAQTGIVSVADISTAQWASRPFGFSDVKAGQTYTISASLQYGRIGGSLSATAYPSGNNQPNTSLGANIQSIVVNTIAVRTFTANKTERIYWFYCTDNGISGHVAFSFTTQLELGSTATAYEPYSGETYTITFPSEAGTVYGGTLDVTTGKLTVDRAAFDLGNTNWFKDSRDRFQSSTPIVTGIKPSSSAAVPANILCSSYKVLSANQTYLQNIGISLDSSGTCHVFDSAYSDAASFKAAVTGQTIVYELATPTVYDLTPTQVTTLIGTNNVWADTGDTTVDYYADPTLYINKKIAAAVAAMS